MKKTKDKHPLTASDTEMDAALAAALRITGRARPLVCLPGLEAADKIMRLTARYFGVTTEDVLGASRLQHIVFARHAAMTLTARHTCLAAVQVAALFGRSRGTLRHAQRAMANAAASGGKLAAQLQFLEDSSFPFGSDGARWIAD